MARGRELAAKGVKGKQREETRWKEIESGAMEMSREASHMFAGTPTAHIMISPPRPSK